MKRIVVVVMLLFAVARAEAQTDGAFIAFEGEHDWNAVLHDMRTRGMTTAIVHYTRDTAKTEYWNDLEKVLDAADEHRINVYVGLLYDTRWYQVDIGTLLSDSKTHASEVYRRFGKRRRFVGWYIPQEIGNSELPLARLQAYFGPLLTHIRSLRGKRPIAVSAYFNPRLQCPADFAQYVKDVGWFDRILLQDGVGERGIRDLDAEVVPYFDAFRAEFGKKRLWSVNEAFCCTLLDGRTCRDSDDDRYRVPAGDAQLRLQADVTRRFVSRTIAFELLKYVGKPAAGNCRRVAPEECAGRR